MIQTLSWTEFNIIGLFGFGRTAPANGAVCLIARDIGGRRIVGVARFVRKGMSACFEREDGSRYRLRDVSGWMDARPVMDFINGSGSEKAATLYM